MTSKNNKGNKPKKVTVITYEKRIKPKKENILLEIKKDAIIEGFYKGFEVIKPVKHYGKYYVLVKNK
ncbi:hypothetical protein CM240_3060 [Clostridium bornimense]|uniref:Uncharacterized protein n=1 Tax=Clostridium bornimense TaxID=1216932 RepID=W6S6Z1_9CLOT|nr:hypothetical protein [Clostridium bornimense]CDM70177.1 hypothetical protein CM240_3060 [Clostridium bornimense]